LKEQETAQKKMEQTLVEIPLEATAPRIEENKKHEHYVNIKDCPVRTVKVYDSLAEVTRILKVNLVPGEQLIILEKIATTIKKDSVRAAGVGENECTILEVIYREREQEVTNDQTRRDELTVAIAKLKKEVQELDALINKSQNERNFVDNYSESICNVADKNAKKASELTKKETLDNLCAFIEFYKKQMQRIDEDIHKLRKQKEVKLAELLNLKNEWAKEKPEKSKVLHREVCISVNSNDEGEAVFIVTYLVGNVGWRATYDIRVSSADNSMSLTYYASVRQNSREHWVNAIISLSTASPNSSNKPPELQTLILGNSYAQSSRNSPMPYSREAVAADYKLHRHTTVEQGVTSSSYTISKESTIPSDNEEHRVIIAEITLTDVQFSYHTVPKKEPTAYLKVKAKNTSPYSFLAGPMNVFFDNNFVATTDMQSVNPQEEFDSFLGKDPAVKVAYSLPQKFRETKGFLRGMNKTTVKRKITIKNKKSVPIKLIVDDQFPMSFESRITIEQLTPKIQANVTLENVPLLFGESCEPGKKTAEKLAFTMDNILKWTVNMEPDDIVVIPIEYAVSWPSDLILSDC
jgi:uncharacterized protein (TIGR02231 family)